jgi:hypothetical protein
MLMSNLETTMQKFIKGGNQMTKKVIGVKFDGTYKTYHYYVLDDYSYEVGDHVVVKARGEFKVVRVVSTDVESVNATVPIVCKVHKAKYDNFFAKKEKKEAIVKKLAAIEKQTSDLAKYRYLSTVSPEAAELVKELESL